MKHIKYLIQFIIIIFLFIIFRFLGLKNSRIISSFIFKKLGSFFRSNNISLNNLSIAFPNLSENEKKEIIKRMWANYGKIFSEYMFIKKFRKNLEFSNKIQVENQDEIEKIKHLGKPVIFISGHFNNFELMAMHIEKSEIDLAAI